MNPDVFITIVFAGIAVLALVAALVFVVPGVRRRDAGVARREPRRRSSPPAAGDSDGEHGAAVH